ncbi:MAG TPA: glycosyltransferase, partial [Azospirillum sp.]
STRMPSIAELIDDGATGVLVPPGDPAALADALAALIGDPPRRALLAAAGRTRVRTAFGCDAGIRRLFDRFQAGL